MAFFLFYRNGDVTGMKEFSASILEPFGLRAKRVTRAYGAFICDTNQGIVLVKDTSETEESLWFAHGAKEHLARQGFSWTDRYQMTRDGQVCAQQNGEVYTVRCWMKAEEAQLTDAHCAVQMAAMLGRMHRAARGYEAAAKSRQVNRCYEWPQRIYKDGRKLQSYSKMLRKNGRYREFDLMVLECLPEAVAEIGEAQKFFLDDKYTCLAERSERERTFGHGSYNDHTVLLGGGQGMITDFEQSCYMIPVVDLVMLLERAMRKNGWEAQLGLKMLESYDRWCQMGEEEKQMVQALMLYPMRFCQLCSEAYQMKRSWMPISYKRKMEEVMEQQKQRKDFLKQLEHVLR